MRIASLFLCLEFLAVSWAAEKPSSAEASADRPNIILIMVDDMGWSDLGCYGGEIDTPHIDSLAETGIRFTDFYNNSVCGATRASLLTGLYCQQTGHPGNSWNAPKDYSKCVLISEVMQAGGYHTAMVGKWQGRDLAVERGWDRFFGPNCQGKVSYWHEVVQNEFYLDDKRWQFPESGFYMTDAFNDYAAEFLKEAAAGEKPFLLYVAHIAPHWPLHAWEKDTVPFRERYREAGWNEWRQRRFERQKEMGLVPSEWELAPASLPDWKDDPHKDWHAERMAVYAAQIAAVDRGVGQLLGILNKSGEAENTLILFLSDNGAARDGGVRPTKGGFGFEPDKPNNNWRIDGTPIQPGSGPDLMPGPPETFAGYGSAWATTSNTPLRDHKQSAYEGGIRTPLIAQWPAVISEGGGITRQAGHVIDIMATCLDVAGLDYPEEFRGRRPLPMEGRSLAPVFRGEEREGHESIGWYCSRGQALRMGDWKLVRPRPNQPWELYDLKSDGTETTNLAAEHADKVKEMMEAYDKWKNRVGARR